MSFSLYDATIPTFCQMLAAVGGLLDKGAAHCAEKGIAPETLIQARLAPDMFTYQHLHAFAAHWLGKLIIFGVITLSLWHAAHRLRVTVHDFGVRADKQVAIVVYSLAGLGTLLTLFYLLRI